MEFSQRGQHQNQPAGAPATTGAPSGKSKKSGGIGWMRLGTGALLLFSLVIVIALIISIFTSKSQAQSKYVNNSQYQAVFLNGGQVYFGKIGTLNDKYLTLSDIYYLRVNQTVQPNQTNSNSSNDVSLVKLGCELHGPQDQMVINQGQVIFWENLKGDGQVTKAITEYKKQNPNGQSCTTTSQTPTTNGTTKQ